MKIYIVLTHTGTILSKIVKWYTKKDFSHVSISLDSELNEMYSFGRLNPYNPFLGGFVHEYTDKGTFKRFKNTVAAIYSLEVTQEQYERIKNIINKIEQEKEKYKFNILGLFAVSIHKKIKKENSFYCAEFVEYLIEKTGMKIDLPEIITPEDFKKLENLELVYTGLLRKYKVNNKIFEKIG